MSNKVESGREAKLNGKSFEAYLESLFQVQNEHGFCDIHKQNEALKPVGRIGKFFKAVYTQKSGCDYFGTLYGGRSVVLEAKYRKNNRLALSDLLDSEFEHLSRTDALGGIAGILFMPANGTLYYIPFRMFAEMELCFNRKSINIDMLKGFEADFLFNAKNPVTEMLKLGAQYADLRSKLHGTL